jgi:hypothetical protein
VVVVVVVELEPSGALPTVPGVVVLVLVEHEKHPAALLKAPITSIIQPKRATNRFA